MPHSSCLPIIESDIYIVVEKRKEEVWLNLLNEANSESSLIAESNHMINKMMFDCINESLNTFKPYGWEGVPFPWTKWNRKLRTDEIVGPSLMFDIVTNDLLKWNLMKVGCLPWKRFINQFGEFDEAEF